MRNVLNCVILSSLLLSAQVQAAGPESLSRSRAIAETKKQLQAELARHGGSWDAWAKQLAPFRKGLAESLTGSWPWKAKKDFVFLGKSVRLLQMDDWSGFGESTTPFDAIVHLDRQLKARDIDLIYVLVPDKLSIYPDYLTDTAPEDLQVALAAKRLLAQLSEADVEVVDLYAPFLQLRKQLGQDKPLYYDRDSHWRNRAAAHAGKLIAQRLGRYDFVQPEQADRYTTKVHQRTDGKKADTVQLVVERKTGQQYQDAGQSPILLTSDSFGMYNMHLGGHLPAHVGLHIGQPVSYLCSEGLSMTMPAELARRAAKGDYLQGRKVIIWTHAGRFLTIAKWQKVDLPGQQIATDGKAPSLFQADATAVVQAVSERPSKDADYPHFVMKLLVKDVKGAEGKEIVPAQAVLRILAMQDRKFTDAATIKPGQTIRAKLTSFSAVEKQWGKIQTGQLEDRQAELAAPEYWAELIKIDSAE
ncbi:MAG: alginate O-acetyltransferase AlgX-related protein [Phycisphaerae bacterium]